MAYIRFDNMHEVEVLEDAQEVLDKIVGAGAVPMIQLALPGEERVFVNAHAIREVSDKQTPRHTPPHVDLASR